MAAADSLLVCLALWEADAVAPNHLFTCAAIASAEHVRATANTSPVPALLCAVIHPIVAAGAAHACGHV